MKVLLVEDVEQLGWLGDIVEVKNGYARNYLLPQGLAQMATDENIKGIAEEKAKRAEERLAEHKRMEKACAEVIIYTNDGRHFSSGRMEAQWEPPDTLPSDDELETKFQWLVEPVLGKEKTQQLVSMMWEFEKLEQVQDFIDSCVV